MRKKLVSLGLALVLALTTLTSTALAHECIVVNRSETGGINAQNSGNWFYVNSELLFRFVAGEVGGDTLTPNQLAWAVAELEKAGAPTQFAIFTKAVLLEGTPTDGTSKMTDGKGIDHVFDYFPTIVAIYYQACGQPA